MLYIRIFSLNEIKTTSLLTYSPMNEIARRIAREEGLCLQEGDFVTRKSYGGDIVFVIRELHDGIAILEGTVYRLIADAPTEALDAAEGNAEHASEGAVQ